MTEHMPDMSEPAPETTEPEAAAEVSGALRSQRAILASEFYWYGGIQHHDGHYISSERHDGSHPGDDQHEA